MNGTMLRTPAAVLCVLLLCLTAQGVRAQSAASSAQLHPSTAPMEALTISVSTLSNAVLGKVMLQYKQKGKIVRHTCARSQCQYRIPGRQGVILKQKSLRAGFSLFKWKVKDLTGATKPFVITRSSFILLMTRPYSVKAVYKGR